MIHALSTETKVPSILLWGAADTMLEAFAKEGQRGGSGDEPTCASDHTDRRLP